MRTRLVVLLTVALTAAGAVLTYGSAPAGAQSGSVTDQTFSGYGDGTAITTNALTLGATTVAGVHAAFSGASVNSKGMNNAINDEFGQAVQPPLPSKDAYGRGTGLEVGVVVPAAQQRDVNQLLISGLAEAAAPPPTPLINKEINLNLAPVIFASLLRGQAQAIFDPNVCAIGQPISFGRGYASNLQLVGAVGSAAVATNTAGDNASESRTFTYFIPNGDGTFGLVSETHQHIAPVSLLGGAVTIQVAGEFVMQTIATGKPGGAKVFFPGNPLLTVTAASVPVLSLRLSDLFGTNGFNLPINIPSVLNLLIQLGVPPHAIGSPTALLPRTAPMTYGGSADGTTASGAVDAVGRVQLSALGTITALDLGLGHMEGSVKVPAGGIKCTIPVSKTATPNPAQVGQDVTWAISIPSDPALFARFFACDLINISATDTGSAQSGNPRFRFTSADRGGQVNAAGNVVTWPNLGNYKRGDPPIVVHVTGRILGGSGVLKDIANVSATLGNCTGGIEGSITGLAGLINGTVTLIGPQVGGGGGLAATGGDARYLVMGGALLLGALELRRRVRRRSTIETTSS